MKGIEIARQLGISTSALRHYESWGIIPPVEREANGYRIYNPVHLAYFQCIRSLNAGFGMDLVKKVMPLIIEGKIHDALWLINQAQVNLHAERNTAQKTVEILEAKDLSQVISVNKNRKHTFFSISDVAKETNVSASSIRHWEREGLIDPERDQESGYRQFTLADIRRVFIIRTVQRMVFSLDIVRQVLDNINENNMEQTMEMARQSLQYIDNALVEQVRGIASLQHLLDVIANQEQ